MRESNIYFNIQNLLQGRIYNYFYHIVDGPELAPTHIMYDIVTGGIKPLECIATSGGSKCGPLSKVLA